MGNLNSPFADEQSRLQLEEDWLAWLESGRDLAKAGHWEGACIVYKRAFSIAEQLLCNGSCDSRQCRQCAVKRYLNTVEEFALAMQQNQFDCALEALLDWVKQQLKDNGLEHEYSQLHRSLLSTQEHDFLLQQPSSNDVVYR